MISWLEVTRPPTVVTYGLGNVVDDDSCGCIPIVHRSERVELTYQHCRRLSSINQVLHVLSCQHTLTRRV